jgi:hypothetical protein
MGFYSKAQFYLKLFFVFLFFLVAVNTLVSASKGGTKTATLMMSSKFSGKYITMKSFKDTLESSGVQVQYENPKNDVFKAKIGTFSITFPGVKQVQIDQRFFESYDNTDVSDPWLVPMPLQKFVFFLSLFENTRISGWKDILIQIGKTKFGLGPSTYEDQGETLFSNWMIYDEIFSSAVRPSYMRSSGSGIMTAAWKSDGTKNHFNLDQMKSTRYYFGKKDKILPKSIYMFLTVPNLKDQPYLWDISASDESGKVEFDLFKTRWSVPGTYPVQILKNVKAKYYLYRFTGLLSPGDLTSYVKPTLPNKTIDQVFIRNN